ncbi:hypothetical protein CK500_14365 [Halorubrum salipaludis]|uniref:Uncharacterized protein n=1 Tax=Halorubrum salipaludis TaxID=2032630 RepID=A0A2A2F7D9_9EURY|nr:hypothetical protein CK500_14365 [Halorubrum salipaludis]
MGLRLLVNYWLDWQPFESAMARDTESQQVTRYICIVDRLVWVVVEPASRNPVVNREITTEFLAVSFTAHTAAQAGLVVTGDDLLTNLWPVRAKRNYLSI